VELTVEVEGRGTCPPLPGGGQSLVAFMSFAVMRGFGAQHPLIALADRLQRVHHLRLGPLTTFYDGKAEDEEDEQKLELAWQDAGGLQAAAEGLARVLADDGEAAALARRAGAEDLGAQAAALAEVAGEAARARARVRLAYSL
jgi:hypothetical protein